MHLDHDHTVGAHTHEHDHHLTHEEMHAMGIPHDHAHDHEHDHGHDCAHACDSCASKCEHTPMEELTALMQYMVGHNASHANELAQLAGKLKELGENAAYEQIMLAVSDFEKGNMRLSTVLAAME